ncbi:MAG: SH3 domain-containing protein, partial [Chloroflexota bacterium]
MRWILTLLGVGLSATVVAAQTQCDALVASTVAAVGTMCRDQVVPGMCYAVEPLAIEFVDDVAGAIFEAPGDEVGLSLLETVTLGPFDSEARNWGVVQAKVPINATDVAATLLMLGEVTVENLGDPAANAPSVVARVVSNQGLNIRTGPSADAALIESVFTGTELRLTGITEDGAWARLSLADGGVGWASVLAFEASTVAELVIVEATEERLYRPMQALEISTRPTTETCAAAPPSGVLLQVPDTSEL